MRQSGQVKARKGNVCYSKIAVVVAIAKKVKALSVPNGSLNGHQVGSNFRRSHTVEVVTP